MARVSFSMDADLPAEAILAVVTNFSERRPHYWPNIDPKVYQLHSKSGASAVVTEGSAMLGGIWAREAYDWSERSTVRATVMDSNVFRPGGVWELRATPRPEGGSHIQVLSHRQARGFKGHVVGTLLTFMGVKVLSQQLQQTLDIISRETSGALTPGAV
jgi:hypothetical protein